MALALALSGDESTTSLWLAWGYVGLRVAHSLVQSLQNPILTRFKIFVTSSVVLAALTGRAVVGVL